MSTVLIRPIPNYFSYFKLLQLLCYSFLPFGSYTYTINIRQTNSAVIIVPLLSIINDVIIIVYPFRHLTIICIFNLRFMTSFFLFTFREFQVDKFRFVGLYFPLRVM